MTFSFRAWAFLLLAWGFAHPAHADDLLPAATPIPEAIDHYIHGLLKDRQVEPAPQASDSALIRRLSLDLVGRVPTLQEAQAFVADSSPNKRERLVDRLLQLPEYAVHQRNELDLMMAGDERLGKAWLTYLQQAAEENRPWDVMFRELMLADQAEEDQGAISLLKAKAKDVDRMTGDISSLFFGVNITCAKCHDHPLVSDWLQDHYYGFQSFFNRTYVTKANFVGEYDEGDVKFKTTAGENKSAQLMFLTGTVVQEPELKPRGDADKKKLKAQLEQLEKDKLPPPSPEFSRREALVNLSLQPGERDFFAKAIVNRIWHRLLGWGMVNPVDQMHSGNPPSHPALLDWLARDLIEHDYDLRRLIRGVALSQTYGRTSEWPQGTRPYADLFAVAVVKPLTPRQLGMALTFATMNPDRFAPANNIDWPGLIKSQDGAVESFASNIEAPSEDFQVSVSEALLFSNNARIVSDYLGNAKDKLLGNLEQQTDRPQALQTVAWNILSRPFDERELALLSDYLTQREDRLNEGWRQIVWALLTGSEFRFNH